MGLRLFHFITLHTLECTTLEQWAFQSHLMVKDSGAPNYVTLRVKVSTELKIYNWWQVCVNYDNQLLIKYLEYGFPLCVDKSTLQYNVLITSQLLTSLRKCRCTLKNKDVMLL